MGTQMATEGSEVTCYYFKSQKKTTELTVYKHTKGVGKYSFKERGAAWMLHWDRRPPSTSMSNVELIDDAEMIETVDDDANTKTLTDEQQNWTDMDLKRISKTIPTYILHPSSEPSYECSSGQCICVR